MLILFAISLAAFGTSAIAIVYGVTLLRRSPPTSRWPGLVLILGGVLLSVSCYSGPSVLFRIYHDSPPLGNYPNDVIGNGMTPDEVRLLLGNPHQVNERDPQ